jgi:hypothetical protein
MAEELLEDAFGAIRHERFWEFDECRLAAIVVGQGDSIDDLARQVRREVELRAKVQIKTDTPSVEALAQCMQVATHPIGMVNIEPVQMVRGTDDRSRPTRHSGVCHREGAVDRMRAVIDAWQNVTVAVDHPNFGR